MNDNIAAFIQQNKHVLNSNIDLCNMKDVMNNYLPTLSHAVESKEFDFYDELINQSRTVFFQFLKALKEAKYKIEAEWIEASLQKMENDETKPTIKGLCLIINNINFNQSKKTKLNARIHSVLDVNALKKAFTKVGFEVHARDDLKASEIIEELKNIETHSASNYSFFAVVISTHGDSRGNRDVLYGTDMETVYKDEVIEELNNNKKTLGKSKIIFFQACRGKKEYSKIPSANETYALPSENIPEENITPTGSLNKISNTTVVHSALPGHKCHTLKRKGSVFCRTLARILERDHENHDLSSMLVTVNKEIRQNFPGEEEFIHIEQMGVTENVYFGPKKTLIRREHDLI